MKQKQLHQGSAAKLSYASDHDDQSSPGSTGPRAFDLLNTPRAVYDVQPAANAGSPEPDYSRAKRINKFGKFFFMGATVVFNLVFWSIAYQEYTKPASEYL